MNQSDLRKSFNYLIHPRGSVITINKGYTHIDNGSMGGTHCNCFYMKTKKSYYLIQLEAT